MTESNDMKTFIVGSHITMTYYIYNKIVSLLKMLHR